MDEIEAEYKIQLDRPQTLKHMREEVLSQLPTLKEISAYRRNRPQTPGDAAHGRRFGRRTRDGPRFS